MEIRFVVCGEKEWLDYFLSYGDPSLEIQEETNNFLKSKFYGDDLYKVMIGLHVLFNYSLMYPNGNRRPRYTRDKTIKGGRLVHHPIKVEKILEFDLVIQGERYTEFFGLSHIEKKKFLINELMVAFDIIKRNRNLKKFDVDRLKSDLCEFWRESGWID